MRYLKYVILIALFCYSCQGEEQLNLPKEKLIKVLVDAHIAEGAAQNLMQPLKDSILSTYYQQIFDIHQVDESNFKADMDYLSRHPQVSKKIYEEVLNEITKKESGKK